MVDMGAIHSLTAELHTGFLTLAFAAIAGVALCQIIMRYVRSQRVRSIAKNARGYLEPAGLVAAIAGVLALALSAATGSLAWSADAILESPLTRNKILLTSFVLALWATIVAIRLKLGKDLWTRTSGIVVYGGTSLIAFSLTAITGSIGAHITQGGSILDPILSPLGIDLSKDLSFDSGIGMAIAVISIAVIVSAIVLHVSIKGRTPSTTAVKWPGWGEDA